MELNETRTPSYDEFLKKAWNSYRKQIENLDYEHLYSYPAKFVRDLKEKSQVTQIDVIWVILWALGWTFLRVFLTKNFFVPFAKKVRMAHNNIEKFPESAWKLFWYSCSWTFSCYTLFYCGYDFFHRPLNIWERWTVDIVVPTEIYIAYLMQMSFYMHSVHGTLYMDQWRKDSIVMLIHHFLTMTLIGFSYAVRYHEIGMLVLFLHDVSDIFLEFAKCNVYLKTRNNEFDIWADRLSTIGLAGFASSWFVFRLYWFPLKALYSASYGIAFFHINAVPFYFIFNALLWVLLALHVYWFMFILILIFKFVSKQELKDVRETDADELTEKEMNVHQKGE